MAALLWKVKPDLSKVKAIQWGMEKVNYFLCFINSKAPNLRELVYRMSGPISLDSRSGIWRSRQPNTDKHSQAPAQGSKLLTIAPSLSLESLPLLNFNPFNQMSGHISLSHLNNWFYKTFYYLIQPNFLFTFLPTVHFFNITMAIMIPVNHENTVSR